MGNYITVEQVRESKVNGVTINYDVYNDSEIEAKITLAEALIEAITQDIFYPKSEVIYKEGNKRLTIYFKPDTAYKLISVNSIMLDDVVLETTDYVLYPYYMVMSETSTKKWSCGLKNIVIDGVWGCEETPPLITEAARMLVCEALIPGSSGLTSSDIRRENWDDYEIEYQLKRQGGDTTGYTQIDNILRQYINYSMLFNVVPEGRCQGGY